MWKTIQRVGRTLHSLHAAVGWTQHRSTGAPDCPGPRIAHGHASVACVWCDPMSNDPRPTLEMCGVYAYGYPRDGGTDARRAEPPTFDGSATVRRRVASAGLVSRHASGRARCAAVKRSQEPHESRLDRT